MMAPPVARAGRRRRGHTAAAASESESESESAGQVGRRGLLFGKAVSLVTLFATGAKRAGTKLTQAALQAPFQLEEHPSRTQLRNNLTWTSS